ncbi:MAG: SPFH domain-containing protein, partial [Planctomycetota bacterium]
FEVSGTWFYKLLSRSFVPMVTLAMLALFAVSSLLIVREGETAIVKQWGQIDFSRKPLTAGVHLKWPWPMGTVDRFETGRRHDLLLGVGQKQEPLIVNGRELYLWTREHGRRKERNFVIALPSEDGPDGPSKAEQSVNVIKLVAQVYYRITDEYKYGYTVTDPDKTLHDLAYGEMTRYCAGATLTEILDSDPDRPEALMTTGRAPAARRLKERIQRAADEYAGSGLGVKVTHVGFLTVHPPAEAAQAYQEVLDAQLRVQQTRYEAMADAHQTLSRVAGDPVTALKLALAVQQVENELSSLADRQDQPLQMRVKMDNALARAREQVEHWSEQVDRDRQLGHGQQELQTANQVMLREHREHLQELEEIDQALREEKLDSLTPSIEQRLARARARLEGEAASGGLLAQATGEAAQVIAEAKAKRWARTLSEEARALAFRRQKRAYESSPQHYMQDKYLAVLEDVLPDIKKYVMGFPRSAAEVRLNLEEEASGMENIDFQNVEGSGR